MMSVESNGDACDEQRGSDGCMIETQTQKYIFTMQTWYVLQLEDIPGLVDGDSVVRLGRHATVRVFDSLLRFGRT